MQAIVVVLNMVLGQPPTKYTEIDVSSNQLYSITNQTKEIVSELDQDVELYLIAQSSNIDSDLQKVLEKYAELSAHITLTEKDPVVNPDFVK